MRSQKTVAQSVREEIDHHRHRLLKIEESARRIARRHKCPDASLIRLALLRSGMHSRNVMQL